MCRLSTFRDWELGIRDWDTSIIITNQSAFSTRGVVGVCLLVVASQAPIPNPSPTGGRELCVFLFSVFLPCPRGGRGQGKGV
jgi:hypothetical protein